MVASKILFIFVSILIGTLVHARLGIDVERTVHYLQFRCLREHGYRVANIGCYKNNEVISSCPPNYYKTLNKGFMEANAYIRPCVKDSSCKPPSTQVNELVEYLAELDFKYVYLFVEASNWTSSTKKNRKLLQDFRSAFETANANARWVWGVHSSQEDWKKVTGSRTWELDSSKPLWYTNYVDGNGYANLKIIDRLASGRGRMQRI
ncbi:hypothetical protein BJV82DRAFT_582854 [Fennellomyces sp. T-0311]|nr:hypothetical protein BJV82DRAFT_582854 [Fennellomyces sp. T-0311]